jgi:hypothetical protein
MLVPYPHFDEIIVAFWHKSTTFKKIEKILKKASTSKKTPETRKTIFSKRFIKKIQKLLQKIALFEQKYDKACENNYKNLLKYLLKKYEIIREIESSVLRLCEMENNGYELLDRGIYDDSKLVLIFLKKEKRKLLTN